MHPAEWPSAWRSTPVRVWPQAALHEGQLRVDTCRSRRTRALATSDANGWSSQMQTGGQMGCKRLVKSGAISHLLTFAERFHSQPSLLLFPHQSVHRFNAQ